METIISLELLLKLVFEYYTSTSNTKIQYIQKLMVKQVFALWYVSSTWMIR